MTARRRRAGAGMRRDEDQVQDSGDEVPATQTVTRCTGGSAVVGSYSGRQYAFFTLRFTCSPATRITLTGITSPDGATWRICPSHPERLTAEGDENSLQFAATPSTAQSSSALVAFYVDGGPEQFITVDLEPWGPGAPAPTPR